VGLEESNNKINCHKMQWNSAFLFIFISVSGTALGSSVNDCRGVKYAYSAKGLDQSDVPRQPRQGSQLQICPSGLTCCTEQMEQKLWSVSKDQYGKRIQSETGSIQRLFNKRGKKFDEFFTELLIQSKLKFHKLFQDTYGIIYERNSDVFIDFFKDLESYYDHGEVNLEEALQRFFSQLYQRMFTVFNAQHNFDAKYLSCVSQTMKKLQPFGDVPKKLTEQLRRSFVASRTFAQALLEGKQIVNKISKIPPKDECVKALTKMSSCPACQGIPEIQPCRGYCINVMKGCLAFHAQLSDSWNEFIDNLGQLADRLTGPFDIEAVVDPIGVKISDAIMNFQNSGYEVTGKVFEDCGRPRLQKRQSGSNAYGYAYGRSRSGSHQNYYRSRSEAENDTRLKNLVRDIRTSLNNTRNFWIKLPYDVCRDNNEKNGGNRNQWSSGNSRGTRYSQNGNCWNGNDAGRYTKALVSDGLLMQERNPEVHVDVNRPDIYINEQILSLKLITRKLESAHKGQNVEWPASTENFHHQRYHESSGSSLTSSASSAASSNSNHHNSEVEGSGGGCSYSDDEDCNYGEYYEEDDSYYYSEEEGSGSGEPEPVKTTSKPTNDEDEDDQQNWPPWVTASPESNKDITVDEQQPRIDEKLKPREPSYSGSSPQVIMNSWLLICSSTLSLFILILL